MGGIWQTSVISVANPVTDIHWSNPGSFFGDFKEPECGRVYEILKQNKII